MGTGWRRAFCTRDRTVDGKDSESPRKCVKLGFLSGVGKSTPSTPRMEGLSLDDNANKLRCKINSNNQIGDNNNNNNSPMLHCKTTPKCCSKSTPASPRSPFAILKNSFRLHKNNCGVCFRSVKTGQGMAIFTAECAHAFHFPCIAMHVRKLGALVCPVCKSTWKDVPLLAFHNTQSKHSLNIINSQPQTPKQSPKLTQNTPISTLNLKPYTDDEPLKTPRGGAAIVTIPEAEDEAEEFQGFFVNPIRSSSETNVIDGGYLRNVTMELLPEVAVVSVGRSHETHVVVLKIKAPSTPPTTQRPAAQGSTGARAPVDLVTVLDVSVSMNGAKLQMMKRAMRLVISSLGAADRLSIMAFSASPKRLLPLRRMTPQGQRAARRIIDRLATSHGSSLAEALNKATKVLEDRRERNPVASIMLLSDGQDEKVQSRNNNGSNNQRRGSNHESSTRFAHMEIPVNSEDGFAKCVSGLLSVVVQDLRVQIGLGAGSDPAEISAIYSLHGRPTVFTPNSIRIGDLYAEEERELLVELKVPTPTLGSHHVLSVSSSYREPSDQETINGREQSLLVPRPQALQSDQPSIQRFRSLFIATRALAESRRLIDHNELSSAYQLLTSSRALLMQSSWEIGEEFVNGLEGELAEIRWRREYQIQVNQQTIRRRREAAMSDEDDEPLTPTSAWRAAEQLAKMAQMKKSMNRVSDLHGFENARF